MNNGKPLPFRRDWLKEAALIVDGSTAIKPKADHVKAVWEEYKLVGNELQKLRDIFKTLVDAAQKERIDRGLPPVALPPMGPIVGVKS
jgi:hypothetical protein